MVFSFLAITIISCLYLTFKMLLYYCLQLTNSLGKYSNISERRETKKTGFQGIIMDKLVEYGFVS